jgi:hypothetical protein
MRKFDGIRYSVFWGEIRRWQVRGKSAAVVLCRCAVRVRQLCYAEKLKGDDFKRVAKNDY